MERNTLRRIIITALLSFLFFDLSDVLCQTNTKGTNIRLTGAFELVSHETSTSLPDKSKITIAPPEWRGLWHFNRGHFSSVLMKEKRPSFYDCENGDFGFESYAGTYQLRSGKITFIQAISLLPMYRMRPVVMNYKFEGRFLVLEQQLNPTIEDQRKGTIRITLKRLDP